MDYNEDLFYCVICKYAAKYTVSGTDYFSKIYVYVCNDLTNCHTITQYFHDFLD